MKKLSDKLFANGSFLIFSMLFSDALNFIFNAYLGRKLSFEEFGLMNLINTFWYLIEIFLIALSTTVNHRIAYLNARVGKQAGLDFYRITLKKSIAIGISTALIWIISSWVIADFFKAQTVLPFIFFTPIIIFGFLYATSRGYLNGNLLFAAVGVSYLIESITKLSSAFFFVKYDSDLVYLSIPISIIVSVIVVLGIIYKRLPDLDKSPGHYYHFPKRFFTAAIITGLSTQLFLTMDVLFTKHFLSASFAGEYAFLSLVGKMVYFFGSMLNVFLIPLVSRAEGLKKNTNVLFYKFFSITALLSILIFVVIGIFGYITVPLFFGPKAFAVIPYLSIYALSMTLFTLSATIVSYHLIRHHFSFPVVSIIMSLSMMVGILCFHDKISTIVNVVFVFNLLDFIVMVSMHFIQKEGGFFIRNLVDLFSLFLPLPKTVPALKNGKRILIFNWRDTHHVYAGGAEVYIHELAKRWVEKGHKVTLFCGNDNKSARYEVIDGVEIIRRGGFYFVYVWAFLYYILKLRDQYDIVIDSENGIPFFTPLYASGKKFLLIHHVHQEVFRTSLKPPFSWFASFLENRFMPYVYKHSEVITVSPSSKREIMHHGLTTKDPVIIYNGVNLERYKPAAKSDKPTVLYLGRLKAYKQIHVFIQAAKRILKDIPDAQFIIAGAGEERASLVKLVHSLNLKDQVIFTGKVSEDQKLGLFQKAWVFVNPSMMEGWGITSIEANACGTPIVASDVPGLRDSVQNNKTGFLVAAGDVSAFSEKITILLTDSQMREKMSKNGMLWAQQFDWQKSADNSLELFK